MTVMHDHGAPLSEGAFRPAADSCPHYLLDLPCGCQDVIWACGYTDYEHDHVACDGTPLTAGELEALS